jgi:fructokinase
VIICCGEALIDMIPATLEGGEVAFRPVSGGAIFNTAIGLGRLGVNVAMLTGLSDDLFGRQLVADLQKSNVNTSLAIVSPRPTTLAFVELVAGKATYSFYDENTAGRMIEPGELPATPADTEAFYFGGISLCSEPGADTYRELAERVSRDNVVVLDPNIRANFISDEASYRARLMAMVAVTDIMKISDEDLDWLIPGDMSEAEQVEQFRKDSRARLVIVTRGPDGAAGYLDNGEMIFVPSQKVTVADTVGAGDTFNSGMLASLSRAGLLNRKSIHNLSVADVEKALQLGARVAAITVSRVGANPPWQNELD